MRQARRFRRLCLGAGLICGALVARALPPTFQTAAFTGQTAPGTGGALFALFNYNETMGPRINNLGQISFAGSLYGQGVNGSNDNGVWFGVPGNVALSARHNDTLADGSTLVVVGQMSLNDSGVFTMFGFDKPVGTSQSFFTIFHIAPSATATVLARHGLPLPGTGFTFGDPLSAPMNNAGQVVLASSDQNSNYALFRGVPGNFNVVMQQGQLAPGANGRAFVNVDSFPTLFNDAGQIVFHSVLDGTPAANGLFFSTPTTLTPIALTSQPLPAPNQNLSFNSLDPKADLDSAGDVIFTSSISSGGSGLWKYKATTGIQTLLKTTDPVPFSSPRTFQTFQNPKIDSKGHFAFEATDSAGLSGIWGGSTPANVRLLVSNVTNVQKDLNERGILVFLGRLSSGAKGVWAADLDSGQVEKVVGTGEPFDVGGGDLRTLNGITLFHESFLNDANQFVFAASFTDGTSGVFVATVPEPTHAVSFLLLAAAHFSLSRYSGRGLVEGPRR
jgi:hypothetical protein